MCEIKDKIKVLSQRYAQVLNNKIEERVLEMKEDDNSHYLLYQVLGISDADARPLCAVR